MADLTPITRKERYLAKAGGQDVTVPDPPITREEMFLKAIADKSGGTSDYTDLTNKPKINNVTLDGNKSWADLGLSNPMHIAGRVNTVNDLPATANEGDVYLVGLVSDTEKAEYVYVSGSWEYLGKNTIEIDDAMSSTSENPVQNKVITGALSGKQSEITAQNPLSADLVDDSTASHKFVTAAEKAQIAENASDISSLSSGKVDKVTGKGLSTNDYTTAEKNKLAGLSNYDDTEVRGLIATNANNITSLSNGKVDKVTGKGLSTNDYTTAEKNKLAGLSNYDDTEVRGLIATNTEKLAGIAETDDDYIELENGTRLYISNTAPTGTIPEGSVGIGW